MFHLLLAIIYLAFISLGLPDALLGSAWPSIYPELGVPVSWAGAISMIIAGGTVVSSLQSDRLTRLLGTGKVMVISVAMTAAALFGFSVSHSFWSLCLWAVPYGLGAGSVDAALNNYVALHYASRHMSWLHCMWGIGASAGPFIMSVVLTGGQAWNMGYRAIALLQVGLTAVLFFSLPLWRGQEPGSRGETEQTLEAQTVCPAKEQEGGGPMTLPQILRIPGAIPVMISFFCYCAVEQTAGLWAGSYLVLRWGVDPEAAAGYSALFYAGIMAGRAVSGFLTLRFSDEAMIRLGLGLIGAGLLALLLPFGETGALGGLILIGLGCAPVYPSMLHATPAYFGRERSQAIIGVQMASAYVGTCLMPPLFGILAAHISIGLFPVYLLAGVLVLAWMRGRLNSKRDQRNPVWKFRTQ
ncbi:MAG TPA: MFS transporter [Candidatus Ventrimonas merdavium]|nr:MFS transporter [Candidatus Ventrimonas merdavium]